MLSLSISRNMHRKSIFDGDSYKAQFARIAYRRLKSRRWVTYAEIMAEFKGHQSPDELDCNVSDCGGYKELIKAISLLSKELEVREKKKCIEPGGNNRNRSIKYTGLSDDPLADIEKDRYIEDAKKYFQFCQDSAGFFPESWLKYFFSGSRDLIDMEVNKLQGHQFITASLDCESRNIELLPYLYDFIKNKQVIAFDYKPYNEELQHLVFHPHFLKEYNGRWHLYGHAVDRAPEIGYDVALDRIESKIQEVRKVKYIPAPKLYYKKYFEKRVGVSKRGDDTRVHVRVRAYSINVFKLIETKKLHWSQEVLLPYGEKEDGTYGEFALELSPNIEFVAQILQKGPDLEIMEPKSLRDELAHKTAKMAELYSKVRESGDD